MLLLMRLLAVLPLPLLHAAGALLGWAAYAASPTYRRHLLENLARVAFLRDAFRKSINDPEFVEKAKKGDRELDYVSGERMGEIAKAATGMSPKVKEIFVSAIRGQL